MTFSKGDDVMYEKSGERARIVAIHYDDIQPYYTIVTASDRERQTVAKYLRPYIPKKKTRRNRRRKTRPTRKI